MYKLLRVLFLLFALITSLFVYPLQTVYAIAIPAEINKQFTPILIDAGGVSVLRVTIFNPNTFALTNASWTDNLIGVQPGLRIANPNGLNFTCGGTVTAVPGTTTLSLSGGDVPAQTGATPGECYVEINVTSTTAGNLINTIPVGALSAKGNDGGTSVTISNTTPASATITVVAVAPPTLSKGFVPNTIFVGGVSQLTITINNNDNDTNLTNTTYTDTLPANVVLAAPVSPIVNNCGSTYSLIAVANTNTIALSNATVTPNLNCTVTVNVTSNVGGQYTNTIPAGSGGPGSIVTQQGVTNGSPASANLNVQPVGIAKVFSPANIVAGGTSTLTITLQNPTGSNYTGVGITDTLPAGLTISGTPASPQCGGTITSTATSVTLTGGTIPASVSPPTPLGTCTITVTVISSATSATTTLTNTIPANSLVTSQLVTNPAPASAPLNVQSGISILKAFSPTSITAGGTSTVTVTLRNYTGANFTGVNLTDTLPANLTVSGTPASPQCGGTITSTATSITLTGGTIPFSATPPGTCTITFQVTSSVAGTYSNTIPAGDLTTDQGIGNTSTTTTPTNLTVNTPGGPVLVSKAFQTSPIVLGAVSRMRITVTAPTDIGVSGINVSDTLPGDLVIVGTPAAPANPVTTCGGTLTATPGTQLINLTGGAINNPSGTCTITVYITTNTPGSYPNTIPAGNVTTTQSRTNTNPSNTATLVVTGFSMSKAFYPPVVQANGLSILTITLQNTSPSALINVQLTDNLPGSLTDGVVVAPVPNASTTCGGTVTATPGTQTITMTGGTIPAQSGGVPGICTITITVQGKDSNATPSNRTNTIPTANVSGTVENSSVTINPIAQAQAVLRTQPLTIGVVKGFNPVLVYGGAYSTMSVQLVNPNNAVLTGITFTDDMTLLGTGMQLANPVSFDVGTCGGVLTGNPGDSAFTFNGGTLPANSDCTLTLRVIMSVNGNLTNRIPVGAVTTLNGVSSTQPAEASLTNLPGASVTKSFNPSPIQLGEYSTLTITIKNTSNIPLVGMALTDNLPGLLPTGLEVAGGTAPSPATDCGGVLSAPAGSQVIALTGGALAGNSTCTITVSVTSATPGTYVNTIPIGGLVALAGGTPISNNNPTSDTLVVNGSVYSLGNRVWFDTDNSGTINGTEVGVNGVTMQLYAADAGGNPTGVALSTQTTANGGYYRFDNLPAGNYVVVIPSAEFGALGSLEGYWSSGTAINGAGVVTETTAPASNTDIDNDDNGTLQPSGAVISSAVTLGPGVTEPTGEADADPTNPPGEAVDGQSNRTVDFGFYRMELGDQIFIDVNDNGAFDAGDLALAGAKVQLYASDGTTEINVGPDGILGTADDAAGGVSTGPSGTYLFSGLPQGDYIVKVTPPPGFASTIDTANPTDTAAPNTNIDENDNGIGMGSGQVSSNIVTLTPGSLGAAANNSVINATGTTFNPTLDFGFVNVPLFSLGNRVWFDTDNSGTINGTEVGVNGVTMQLYAADANGNPTGAMLSTQTTANGGYYRFDDLPAGDYVVVIPSGEFGPGGTLDGYWSSGTTLSGAGTAEIAAPDADNDIDSDDNGTFQTAGAFNAAVISSAITLGPGGSEPTGELDLSGTGQGTADDYANMTVDFGFYRVEIGDLIFVDVNKNGTFDAGDLPLAGAKVQLYASDGVTELNVGSDGIFGTADDAAGGITTGAGGTYLFSGLPQGNYIVKVTPPSGYSSTVDTADSGDTANPDINTNNNDNGIGTSTGQVSSGGLTMTPAESGANITVSDASGTTLDTSVDFGFVLPTPGNPSDLTKSISSTDQQSTSDPNVAIGEIVTYQVSVVIPANSVFSNASLVDTLDRGLSFTNCVTISAAGLTTDVTDPNQILTPFDWICANPTVDSNGSPDPVDIGRRVTFNLGTLSNTGATNQTLTVTYRVIVLNNETNKNGFNLKNSAEFNWGETKLGPASTTVQVVEPHLSISKTSNTTFIALGTQATFTLTIQHTSASKTDAFDVVVEDVLPAALDFVDGSMDCTLGAQDPAPADCYYVPATRTIHAAWSSFTLSGGIGRISFRVVGNANLSPTASVTNVGTVQYTSLPGIFNTPQSPNPYSTERDYDPGDSINTYQESASFTLNVLGNGGEDDGGGGGRGGGGGGGGGGRAFLIPVTGFAPGVVTDLSGLPFTRYNSNLGLSLEIPKLKLNIQIVGVPLENGDWDVTWLTNQAGWLQKTAFPGLSGNSVLTSHITSSYGADGPFARLSKVAVGDRILVHAFGQLYTYEIKSTGRVQPSDISIFKHEDKPWLTLVTCANYDKKTSIYQARLIVRAVLIDTQVDLPPSEK